jgi:hypothetical protein
MALIEYNNRHKSNRTDIWAHEEFIPQLIFLPCSLLRRRRRRRRKEAWIPLMLLSPLSLSSGIAAGHFLWHSGQETAAAATAAGAD